MNIFAGNFTLKEKVELGNLDFDIIILGEKSYFIMWWDENLTTVEEIVAYLEQEIWAIECYDISIDHENKVEILMSETEGEVYENVIFSGPNTVFEDILERFADSDEAICIREWKTSQFRNKEVIVDFLY